MRYRIEYLDDVYDQLAKISVNIRRGILNAVDERLSEAPRRFKPLVGNCKGFFRLCVGDYRVIYKVEDERVIVVVVCVVPRGCVY